VQTATAEQLNVLLVFLVCDMYKLICHKPDTSVRHNERETYVWLCIKLRELPANRVGRVLTLQRNINSGYID